ncbi:MAG: dethiobiotin synthase [Burkholderiaceae bacterium]|nr:MAG: dethiobiotin synthase [Burkholderiaceae bacterium]
MNIFVTGTDTDVGKTLVCSWLCLHTQADYWKPIQCGTTPATDSDTVAQLSGVKTWPETYRLQLAASPHLAAAQEDVTISTADCRLPTADRLIIEGAGGVLVPLNERETVLDLIAHLEAPVLLVARSTLGTINHTCLSLHALRARNIPILGVIMCGPQHADNKAAIEHYGQTKVLAEFHLLNEVTRAALQSIPLPKTLRQLLS